MMQISRGRFGARMIYLSRLTDSERGAPLLALVLHQRRRTMSRAVKRVRPAALCSDWHEFMVFVKHLNGSHHD
jgi:hypothetical protein